MNPTYSVAVVCKPSDRSIALHLGSERHIELREFDRLSALLQGSIASPPQLAVIDLDVLDAVTVTTLESIRAGLPSSELIAVSSQDTSQAVLMCFRCGFKDFLLKPIQPEELKWTVQRAIQRSSSVLQPHPESTALSTTVLDIASATSPTVIRLHALKQLCYALGAKKGIWLDGERMSLAFPKKAERESRDYLTAHKRAAGKKNRYQLRKRRNTNGSRQLSIFLRNPQYGSILLWGIDQPVYRKKLREILALIEYVELGLRNLSKLADVRLQTYLDDLTELYNARYLRVALKSIIEDSKSRKQSFSLLFVDLDRFKQINDEHGHTVGSEVLVLIGKTLKNSVRKHDAVFRYGGDEFVILLKNTAEPRAREVGERLRRMVEKRTFIVQEKALQITVSVGVAVYPQHASTLEELLKLADHAMYEAKRRSRNAVHVATAKGPTSGYPSANLP